MSGSMTICVGVGAVVLLATALAMWRGSPAWLAAAIVGAILAIGSAVVRARLLEGHTLDTQIALGSGLVAVIALMIRFGLGAVARQVDRS